MAEPSAHEVYRSATRFDALDGLRAVAAGLVVAHHCVTENTGYLSRSIGVTTFFVLSGFLITRMLIREKEEMRTIEVRRFLLRRTLRIFPLYYVVLGIYVVLVARFERGTPSGAGFWHSLPWYVTFTSNWFAHFEHGQRDIFYFSWSLAVQEQFYLLWPFVLRFTRRRWAALVPLLFLLSSDALNLLDPGGANVAWHRVVAGFDFPIYFGVLTAIALENRRVCAWAEKLAGRSWSIPAALLLMLVPLAVPAEPQDIISLSACYLVAACAFSVGPAARLLDNRPMRAVGKVSYGMYLFHMLVLNAVRRAIPVHLPAVLFLVTLALTILAALASYRWFEQPVLRWGLRRREAAVRLAPAGG